MSVHRSPPDTENSLRTPPMAHYGSDSAINTSYAGDSSRNLISNTKRQKISLFDFADCSAQEIGEIKSMFTEIKNQQDQKFDSLSAAMSMIISQNQEIKNSIKQLNCQHDNLLMQINGLENENKEYKIQISSLEHKVELLEKQARSATIEIRNIPKQDKENKLTIINIVKDISETLGMDPPIQSAEVREIYRSKNDTIVVDFTSTTSKEAMVMGFKKSNKTSRVNKVPTLNTAQLKMPGNPRAIYISEFLTNKSRHLYYLARQGVKNKKLHATWTSYGTIYAKKEEEIAPVRIDSEEDLLQLML